MEVSLVSAASALTQPVRPSLRSAHPTHWKEPSLEDIPIGFIIMVVSFIVIWAFISCCVYLLCQKMNTVGQYKFEHARLLRECDDPGRQYLQSSGFRTKYGNMFDAMLIRAANPADPDQLESVGRSCVAKTIG